MIDENGLGILLSKFNNEIILKIKEVLFEVNINYMEDDFSGYKISNYLSMDNQILIELYSNDYNFIKIDFNITDCSNTIIGIPSSKFETYFKFFLYDTFVFSRYLPFDEIINMEVTSTKELLSFVVTSKGKLFLNSDSEY